MPEPSPAEPPIPSKFYRCPFTVIADSREQEVYHFLNIRSDARQGRLPIRVDVVRHGLKTGDYSIFGHVDRIAIERKSKPDLFASMATVAKRKNFEGRLDRMSAMTYAAVIVEADLLNVCTAPVPFTQLLPKSVGRTILAWTFRYPTVHWWFMPNRAAAEIWTFRILERYWRDHRPEPLAPPAG